MSVFLVFQGNDKNWNIVLVISSGTSLLINLLGLMLGGTTIFFPLLYIPVVIGSYRYPRAGPGIAVVIGVLFFLMATVILGGTSPALPDALVRAFVLVIIGWLIAILSGRLREQENLYRGLFDHSEAGSVLVIEENGTWTVEDINWNAAVLLGRSIDSIKGEPLTSFISDHDEQSLFSRLSHEGKVYAGENQGFHRR